jgi:hypothetical protein
MLKNSKKQQLEQDLIEGYQARRGEDKRIIQEWECTLLDGINEEYYQVGKGIVKIVGRSKNT